MMELSWSCGVGAWVLAEGPALAERTDPVGDGDRTLLVDIVVLDLNSINQSKVVKVL